MGCLSVALVMGREWGGEGAVSVSVNAKCKWMNEWGMQSVDRTYHQLTEWLLKMLFLKTERKED